MVVALRANAGRCHVGTPTPASEFFLTPAEQAELVAKDINNLERIVPFVGVEELHASTSHDFDRFVIDFGTMSLEEAGFWPDLLTVLRERIATSGAPETRWWLLGEKTSELADVLESVERVLVLERRGSHHALAFMPSMCVFSEALVVIAIDDFASFAVLQSRAHQEWIQARADYQPSDFETFPFPRAVAMAAGSELDTIGQRFYEARLTYMDKHKIGLSAFHARFDDAAITEPSLAEPRALYEDLNRAVLSAYAWDDFLDAREKLVELNARRAQEEIDENRLETYQQLSELIDIDVLHSEIAAKGIEVLDRGVPYIVRLARWRSLDRFRRASKHLPIDDSAAVPSLFTTAAEQILAGLEANESRAELLRVLGELPRGDMLALWRHAEGVDDEAIAVEIARVEKTKRISAAGVRQRRARALRKLRERLPGA